MNPIRFTLLITLLAILTTIIAALFAPAAPGNQADYLGPDGLPQNSLGQPAAGGSSVKPVAPPDCAPNCLP